VDRNRIKRLLRESIRHQKNEFYQTLHAKKTQLLILVNYQPKAITTKKNIEEATAQLLKKISNALPIN
jgi:ribonuclease P protein component